MTGNKLPKLSSFVGKTIEVTGAVSGFGDFGEWLILKTAEGDIAATNRVVMKMQAEGKLQPGKYLVGEVQTKAGYKAILLTKA